MLPWYSPLFLLFNLQHAGTIGLLVSGLLEEHEVDEETSSKQNRLYLDIQIHGEGDAEVVRVGERFTRQPRPLLRYLAHFGLAVLGVYMKFNISTNGERANRSLDSEDNITSCVLDAVAGLADGPLLLNGADHRPWWGGHLHALQPTWAPA